MREGNINLSSMKDKILLARRLSSALEKQTLILPCGKDGYTPLLEVNQANLSLVVLDRLTS